MPKLKDISVSPPKVLIYGPAGGGKTASLLTLGGKAQVIDLDSGLSTGLFFEDKFHDRRGEVDVLEFAETNTASPSAYRRTLDHVQDVQRKLARGTYPFLYFGIDSFTSLAGDVMNYVMVKDNKLGQNPQLNHWGFWTTELKRFLIMLKSLPIAVVMTAHQRIDTIDDRDSISIGVQGKVLPAFVPTIFDEVLYLKVRAAGRGKQSYCLMSKPTPSILARSRHSLPDGLDVDLGLEEIMSKYMGYPKEGETKNT